jgi:hypothetical protein
MTPRIRIAATLLLASLTARAEVPELDALLAGFTQPAPARTAYFERRQSPLLMQPLLFGGELSQPAADELVKTIEGDTPERLRIAGERVEVQREGQNTRRFSLRRAPELAALASSLRALLGGDRGLLERHFAIELAPSGAGWTLDLTPIDARVTRKVRGMRLHGVGAEWRCFDLDLAEDERSRMWLGPWAESARAAASESARDALCGTAAE